MEDFVTAAVNLRQLVFQFLCITLLSSPAVGLIWAH